MFVRFFPAIVWFINIWPFFWFFQEGVCHCHATLSVCIWCWAWFNLRMHTCVFDYLFRKCFFENFIIWYLLKRHLFLFMAHLFTYLEVYILFNEVYTNMHGTLLIWKFWTLEKYCCLVQKVCSILVHSTKSETCLYQILNTAAVIWFPEGG